MSRQARMLLVVTVAAVVSIIVLSMMAERYGSILRDRKNASGRSAAAVRTTHPESTRPSAPERPAAARASVAEEAASLAAAYADVLASLDATLDGARSAGASDGEVLDALRATLQQELTTRGMTRADFDKLVTVHRAWRERPADVPEPLRGALETRAAKLAAVDLSPYDPRRL